MKKILNIIFAFILIFSLKSVDVIHAQNFNNPEQAPVEETFEATVTSVLEDSETKLSDGEMQIYQKLELIVKREN